MGDVQAAGGRPFARRGGVEFRAGATAVTPSDQYLPSAEVLSSAMPKLARAVFMLPVTDHLPVVGL